MNKFITIYLISLLFCVRSNAQNLSADKVPEAVRNAFKIRFPTVENVSWEMEKPDHYEAAFATKQARQTAEFDANGKLVEIESEIQVSELPKTVSNAIADKFADCVVQEASKTETADNKIVYEVIVLKGKMRMELTYATNGKCLKTEIVNSLVHLFN